MIVAFYTKIRPAWSQSENDVIKRAHALGYELIKFNGFPDSDIGYNGNRGRFYKFSRKNLDILKEIQAACMVESEDGYDCPMIFQSVPTDNPNDKPWKEEYDRLP